MSTALPTNGQGQVSAGQRIAFTASVRGRLLLIVLALVLIPLAGVSTFAYLQSQSALREASQTQVMVFAQVASRALQTWVAERLGDVGDLAGTARVRSMDLAQISEVVPQYHQKWGTDLYELIFVAGLDGKTIFATSGPQVDLSDRAYFQKARGGEPTVSDIVISRASGNPVFVIAVPIESAGKVVGVLGATLNTRVLVEELTAAQIGQTGEAYLVNRDGFMITPSRFTDDLKRAGLIKETTVLELKVDTDASRQVLAGQTGSGEYLDYRGNPVLGAYVWLDSLNWGLISELDSAEAFAAVTQLRNILLGVGVGAAILVGLLVLVFANSLANPIVLITEGARRLAIGDVEMQGMDHVRIAAINRRSDELGAIGRAFTALIEYFREMAGAAQRLADGDLTAVVEPRSDQDLAGHAFARMITSLRTQVGKVAEAAAGLSAASAQLAGAAAQAGDATGQITVTMQQIATGTAQQTEAITRAASSVEQLARAIDGVARGAQEQAASVAKSAAVVNQISSAIGQVTASAQAGAQGSQQAAAAARSGVQTVEQTIAGMHAIRDKVGQSTAKVREMGQRSDQIGLIVQTIDEIASQTNLLALNAAIEAARAGEHGKGFAVVADEVRKLAEKSTAATKEIADLIRGIQATIAEAVRAMDEGATEVETGVSRANQAGEVLNQILAAAEAVNRQVAEIAASAKAMEASAAEMVAANETVSAVVEENTAATEEMAASSGEVTQSIEGIASISQENSAAAEQVTAAAEEMSAQVEEVTASAQSLAEMAQQLQAVVEQFRLNESTEQSGTRPVVAHGGGISHGGGNGHVVPARREAVRV